MSGERLHGVLLSSAIDVACFLMTRQPALAR